MRVDIARQFNHNDLKAEDFYAYLFVHHHLKDDKLDKIDAFKLADVIYDLQLLLKQSNKTIDELRLMKDLGEIGENGL